MISIILATYNGEKYLAEQLNSLFAQTNNDFKLYISDDCSPDKTRQEILRYKAKYSNEITATFAEKNSGSAKYNFMRMIIAVKDDYMFLCDQDDIWLRQKIEKSLKKLYEMESIYGKNTPLLVHTDLKVVDQNLNVIATSYREQVLHPAWEKFDFPQALVMNIATGSTIAYNRALAELITEMPASFVMHDWWLLQAAYAFGKVGHIFEPTVLYRQHGGNEVGSSNVKLLSNKLKYLIHKDKVEQRFKDSYRQAEAFRDMFGSKLSRDKRNMVETYSRLGELNKIKRLQTLFSMGAVKYGMSRKIATILFA